MGNKIVSVIKNVALTFVFLIIPSAFGFENSRQIPLWVAVIIDMILVAFIVFATLAIFVVISER